VDNKKKEIKSKIIFALLVQLIISVFFAIIIFLLAKTLSLNYFEDIRAYQLLIFLSLYYGFDSVNEVLFRVFHGYQKMFLNQFIEFSFSVFTFIGMVLVVFFRLNIYYFGLVYLIASLVNIFLFSAIFLKKIFPDFLDTKYNLSKKTRKQMFDYSLPTMMSNMASQLFGNQTVLFLVYFSGPKAVGYYIMSRSLAKLTVYLFKSFSHVFSPMIAELWKKKSYDKINYYFNEITTYSLFFGIPISLLFVIFSKEILLIFFGKQFIAAATLLKLLSIHFLFFSFTTAFQMVFLNIGLPKISRNITYLSISTNLLLNLILIPKYGMIGAGISDLISVIISLIITMCIKDKYIKIMLPKQDLMKLFFLSFIFISLASVLKRIINLNIYLESLLILVLCGASYVLMAFMLRIITIKKIKSLVDLLLKK